jgi:MFS family permease
MVNRAPIQLRPIAVVAAIATLFTAMQGLSYPLLAVVLDRRGAQSGFIGLNTAMMPLGMILAAPLAAPLMHRIGGRALAAISILAAVVGFMMIGAITNPWAWMPLRLLLGFSLACLFVVSDTWMIELATEEVRGRVLGFYSMLQSVGFALGPALLLLVGPVPGRRCLRTAVPRAVPHQQR